MASAMLTLATSSKDLSETVNDLTICSICLDTLKVPKYFSCLHTFCLACLHGYIDNAFSNRIPKYISCPVCRTKIKVPDSVINAEDWSNKLPVNHIILSLIDAQKMQKGKSHCGPCKKLDGNKESVAKVFCYECREAFCEGCSKYHKAFKSFMDHELVEIGKISDVHLKIGSQYTTCNEHTKKIEVYCNDHKEPCCLHCVTLEHRKCNEVISIDEAAQKLRDGDAFLNLMNGFGSLLRTFNSVIEEQEYQLSEGQNDEKVAIGKIQSTRKSLEKELLKLEQKCKDELSFRCGENISNLSKSIQNYEEKKKMVIHCQKLLKAGLDSNSDIQLLYDYNNMKAQKEELESYLQENVEIKYMDIKVEIGEAVTNMMQQVGSLGTVVVNENSITTDSVHSSLLDCSPHKGIDYVIQDAPEAKFSGIAYHDGCILLVDRYKRRLYVFDDDYLDTTSYNTVKLKPPSNSDSAPWDVAGTTSDHCIVTFPELNVLADVDINSCKVIRWIEINNPQSGICYYNNTIITTYRSTGKGEDSVSVFCMNGNLLRERKACRPNYLCVDNVGRIIYSDRVEKKVICMTYDFKTVFVYSHEKLDGISGITSDTEGNIYIAGFVSNNIHQLTTTGKLNRIILTEEQGIINPRGITFKNDTDGLLVLNDSGQKITLFRMSSYFY